MTIFNRRELLALAGTAALTAALPRMASAQTPASPQASGAASPPRTPRPAYDPNAPLKVEIGRLKALDPEFNTLAEDGAVVERIANVEGNAEGPCWIPEEGGYLIHSDPPMNIMWKWNPKDFSHTVFKQPSGFFGADPDKVFREPGSNGIHYWKGSIIYADSGNRSVMKMNLKTRKVEVLADRFGDKRLNSPNDIAIAKDGTIFFTDPPYGLNGVAQSKYVELDFHGIFRIGTDGQISVVDRDQQLINGIGISPDGKLLYACGGRNSRSVFDLDSRNMASNKRDFGVGETGGDGLKVSTGGHLWCSGGPGLIIFNPAGKRIGLMETNMGASNCYFGGDGYLYISMGHSMGRVRVKAKGVL